MRGLAFYEVGCHEINGMKRIVVPFRRLLRRLLRPIFLRLDSQLNSLDHRQSQLDFRQNELDRDLKAVRGMGWDHVAIARRLAMLEDHVEALLSRESGGDLNPLSENRARPIIHYPRLDAQPSDDAVQRVDDAQVKAG
jgi:hypothetical protein